MNPAAPVTRRRIEASLVGLLVVAFLVLVLLGWGRRVQTLPCRSERTVDFRALWLERARMLQIRHCLRAAVELQQRVAEVVVRESFGWIGRAGAAQPAHG